jgi:hypothetical protein
MRKSESKMPDELVKQKVFEHYKMFWMLDHGITIKDICQQAHIWANDCDADEESFEEYLEDHGFSGGSLWPCYDEFLDNEFWERGTIESVLAANPELLKAYEEIFEEEMLLPFC